MVFGIPRTTRSRRAQSMPPQSPPPPRDWGARSGEAPREQNTVFARPFIHRAVLCTLRGSWAAPSPSGEESHVSTRRSRQQTPGALKDEHRAPPAPPEAWPPARVSSDHFQVVSWETVIHSNWMTWLNENTTECASTILCGANHQSLWTPDWV